jgi:hypothetical protein
MMQLNALPDGTHQGPQCGYVARYSSGAICGAVGGLSAYLETGRSCHCHREPCGCLP